VTIAVSPTSGRSTILTTLLDGAEAVPDICCDTPRAVLGDDLG
jgi:hypothetical protein